MEERVHRAIQAAGGKPHAPDVYVMAGSPDVFVRIHRASKGKFGRVSFEIPIATASQGTRWLPPLELAREDADHRANKARGRMRELQTGDQMFDATVYIDTPAREREVTQVLDVAAFREAVLSIFRLGVLSVELVNGRRPRLVVEPGHIVEKASIAAVADRARAAHRALPTFGSTAWRPRFGPAGVLVRVTAISILPSMVSAMVATDHWETVDNALAWHAALASIAPFVLFVLFVRHRANKSSRGVFRFWATTLAALIAFPTATITAAYAINAELDETMRERTVEVDAKYETRSGKSTFLYVRLRPWPPLTEPVIISPDGATYRRLPEQGPIRASVGQGRLGYLWVRDIAPLP